MRISLIGQPGAGKSTLANILSGMFDVMVISSGDLARANGFAGSEAEKSGNLDPNEDKIRGLVVDAIGDSDHYILDGFPRTIQQIDSVKIALDAVLYLNMETNPLIGVERLLKRGRPDDTEDIIHKRIATYLKYTHPLVERFDNQGKLIYVDATGSVVNTLQQAVVQLGNQNILEVSHYIRGLIREFNDDPTKFSHKRKSTVHRGFGKKGEGEQ